MERWREEITRRSRVDDEGTREARSGLPALGHKVPGDLQLTDAQ